MKNIYVIPTDKPSRLIIQNGNKLILGNEEYSIIENRQHIYITTSKDIEVGDYYYLPRVNSIYKCIEDSTGLNLERRLGVGKIILTTDPELINDGVQGIDDEFLEWFMENPGCEYLETYQFGFDDSIIGHSKKWYTLTPEPKQITLEEAVDKDGYLVKEEDKQEILPTKWFKTEQISTWIGESLTTEGKSIEELNGGHGVLVVQHQCGYNKKELITQLKTMINGLEDGFDNFVN